mgnify:CR=1 FL=1
MSAPDTNTEKQVEKHKTPLMGMLGVAIFAGVLLLALAFWISATGNEPGEEDDAALSTPGLTIAA